MIIVPVAFAIAGLSAAIVFVSLGLERVTLALQNATLDETLAREVMGALTYGSVVLSALTIVPVLLLVIIGEVARIRSVLYYVVSGGVGLAGAPLLASLSMGADLGSSTASVWQVAATAGFFGGFVYWLIAGRTA